MLRIESEPILHRHEAENIHLQAFDSTRGMPYHDVRGSHRHSSVRLQSFSHSVKRSAD